MIKETLAITFRKTLWHVNYVYFIASGVLPPYLTLDRKRRFLHDVRRYLWEELFLYKKYADQLVKKVCFLGRDGGNFA